MTAKKPSKKEVEDLQFGWETLETLGMLDIGQCVVVKNRVIISVEAVEGTDEAITRGGKLGGKGSVVIKRTKPHQDLRFDLPAIGPQTIQTMIAAQASVLAIEAKKTVILDREEVFSLANEAGIAIIGKVTTIQSTESDSP